MKTSIKKLVVTLLALLGALILACSCGKSDGIYTVGAIGPQGPQGEPGASVTAPIPVPTEDLTVSELVKAQNEYRESQGQEDLIQGLSCNLYTVAKTSTSIANEVSPLYVASFAVTTPINQPNAPTSQGFNVLPVGLQSVIQTWFVMKCYGQLVVADSNYHTFQTTSDDGSTVYIDGQLVVNNDGQHSAATVTGSHFLEYGFHSFEIDFFQGNGSQELILNQDGTLMPMSGLWH